MEKLNTNAVLILLIIIVILLISNIIMIVRYELLYKRCEKYVLKYYRMKQKFQDVLKGKINREN